MTACRSVELDVQRLAHIRASLHNIRSRHSSAMANNAGTSPAAGSAGGPRLQGAALPAGSGPVSHSTVLSGAAAAGPETPQSSTGSAAIRLPSAEVRQRSQASAELAGSELPDITGKRRVAPELPDAAVGPRAAQGIEAETGVRLQQRAAWAMAQSSPLGGSRLSDSSIENHSYAAQPGSSLLRSVGSGAQGPPFASRDLNRQLNVSDLTTCTCS